MTPEEEFIQSLVDLAAKKRKEEAERAEKIKKEKESSKAIVVDLNKLTPNTLLAANAEFVEMQRVITKHADLFPAVKWTDLQLCPLEEIRAHYKLIQLRLVQMQQEVTEAAKKKEAEEKAAVEKESLWNELNTLMKHYGLLISGSPATMPTIIVRAALESLKQGGVAAWDTEDEQENRWEWKHILEVDEMSPLICQQEALFPSVKWTDLRLRPVEEIRTHYKLIQQVRFISGAVC